MMAIAIRLLSSRAGLAVVALMAALSWHYIDKAAAVRSAERGLADQVLIESLKSQRDEANRRAALAELAKKNLRLAVDAANKAALDAEKELEEYAATTTQNNDCAVDQSIIDTCETARRQAIDAGRENGELEASKQLPEYPDDCRKKSRSGVRAGERLDVALLRTDQALSRQNDRTKRCAAWYDELKRGTADNG